MKQQLLAWVNAHPLIAYVFAGALLSSLWYRIRGAVWPGADTPKLPTWARLVQALIEFLCNAPGVYKALNRDGAPPGTPSTGQTPNGGATSAPSGTARMMLEFGAECAMVLVLFGVALLVACSPARTAIVHATPGSPTEPCSTVGTTRCSGAMVQGCGASGWWPMLPAECPDGCEETDAGAQCSRRDAGGDE